MSLQLSDLVGLYEQMLTIRVFEERVVELFAHGKLYGFPHLYVGEEAVAVGVLSQTTGQDFAASTHRGHGHCLAKGMDPGRVMAELAGRRDGYSRGKGGTMHLASAEHGIVCNAIMGGGVPAAVGWAWAAKLRGSDAIAVAFFGDGAANQGVIHESMNLAAINQLPVVFVCENNQFAVSVPHAMACAVEDVATRSDAYGIPGAVVDGMDVVAVHEAAEKAITRARGGLGPTLLECKTYRFRGHHEGDPNVGTGIYRSREEVARWRERDPIESLSSRLLASGLESDALGAIQQRVGAEIERAVEFALAAEFPDESEAFDDVFAPDPPELLAAGMTA